MHDWWKKRAKTGIFFLTVRGKLFGAGFISRARGITPGWGGWGIREFKFYSLEGERSIEMLINISNHPHEKWGKEQLEKAVHEWDMVVSIPFPNVPPAATYEEVQDLASQVMDEVEAIKAKVSPYEPVAIHVMGEMGLTYALVRRVGKTNLTMHSCTERISEEVEGRKVSTFRFLQFREY
jgi:hypothetical protein